MIMKSDRNCNETEGQRYSMGDTAAASDLQWMVTEFGFGGNETESGFNETLNDSVTFGEILRQHDNQPEAVSAAEAASPYTTTINNSLSRTLDEEELLVLAHSTDGDTGNCNLHNLLGSVSQKDAHGSVSQSVPKSRSTSTSTSTSGNSNKRVHCIPGPNEQLYVQHYQLGIQNRIQQHRQRHPNDLPIYSQLSDVEKLKEQQMVLRLLQRLKIAAAEDEENLNISINWCQQDTAAAAQESAVSTDKEILLPNRHCHANFSDDHYSLGTDGTDQNGSELLLSPPPPAASALLHDQNQSKGNDDNLQADHSQDSNYSSNDNSFDSTESVEQTRAAPFYDSPASSPNNKKRVATTSGKRGADAARLRMFQYNDEPSLLHSIGRLSLHDDGNVFSASQSPISQHLTNSPLRHQPMDEDSSLSSALSNLSNQDQDSGNKNHWPDISFGRDDSSLDDSATINNDSHSVQNRPAMSHTNDTLVETSMLPGKMVRWDFDGKLVKNAPTDVRLAAGQVFNYAKLPVQIRDRCQNNSSSNNNNSDKTNTRRAQAANFPDPFACYDNNAKLHRRLHRLYEWVLRRDQAAQTKDMQHLQQQSACAVLSIELEYIVDLVLKLALEYPADNNDPQNNINSSQNDNAGDALPGQTLILARTKEELEIFGRAFRERSAFSVLDHSILPLKDRKSQTTAARAAQFDIVLTTYDALKAPDSTITLNERGHAIHRKDTGQDGWYTSKNSGAVFDPETDSSETVVAATTVNKQFSVLHRMVWRRVVFVDALGRKCFLAKAGTTRVGAATALSARSRLAFLERDKDTKEPVKGFKSLKQSNRTALSSLSAVLRLSTDDDEAARLEQNIVDFLDRKVAVAASK